MEGNFILADKLWILFIIDTILIAAGGYIINDLMDQKADSFNKPEKIYIGSDKISLFGGWMFYFFVVLIGFGIAYYIACRIDRLPLLSIYPIAVGLLYLYSTHLKRLPLIGNLVVSIFCAFVPGIIWFAELEMINSVSAHLSIWYGLLIHLFVAYISFAFLSTMVREIIKDIEDMEGDLKSSYRTLPIVAGKERAKVIALFFAILLLCSFGLWFFGFSKPTEIILCGVITIGLVLPTLFIIRKIYIAKSTEDFTTISKLIKFLMIVSLFIFLCTPFILNY
jgi:4-hydroxybenzoate polyprenyltransferase